MLISDLKYCFENGVLYLNKVDGATIEIFNSSRRMGIYSRMGESFTYAHSQIEKNSLSLSLWLFCPVYIDATYIVQFTLITIKNSYY